MNPDRSSRQPIDRDKNDRQKVDIDSKDQTLYARVGRAKARWLKRVMYHPKPTSTEKRLAFAIADHLNCVTLDSWPGQDTLAYLLGQTSIKTIQRSACGLETLGLLRRSRTSQKGSSHRYAPVFCAEELDIIVGKARQRCPAMPDTNVRQSSSGILLTSVPTAVRDVDGWRAFTAPFRRTERGAIEIKVAELLGVNGLDVLAKLASLDDAIIDRLCQAYVDSALGDRDLAAARLAAKHIR
jgi:hypothetical protein